MADLESSSYIHSVESTAVVDQRGSSAAASRGLTAPPLPAGTQVAHLEQRPQDARSAAASGTAVQASCQQDVAPGAGTTFAPSRDTETSSGDGQGAPPAPDSVAGSILAVPSSGSAAPFRSPLDSIRGRLQHLDLEGSSAVGTTGSHISYPELRPRLKYPDVGIPARSLTESSSAADAPAPPARDSEDGRVPVAREGGSPLPDAPGIATSDGDSSPDGAAAAPAAKLSTAGKDFFRYVKPLLPPLG